MKVNCYYYREKKCLNAGMLCNFCTVNHDRPKTQDYCMQYIPTCRFGYMDCIYDPAYIKYHYPDWYKELYGDGTPIEMAECGSCAFCKDGSRYDDEDK